jgi:hypothetical protein
MTKRTQKETTAPQAMGQGAVKDIVDQSVREAVRTQAREMEKHLQSIHERLVALEQRR